MEKEKTNQKEKKQLEKAWRYFKRKIGIDDLLNTLKIDKKGKKEFKEIYKKSIVYAFTQKKEVRNSSQP